MIWTDHGWDILPHLQVLEGIQNNVNIMSCFIVCVFIFLATQSEKKHQKKAGGWFIAATSTFMIAECVTKYFSKGINKLINASHISPVEFIFELWYNLTQQNNYH